MSDWETYIRTTVVRAMPMTAARAWKTGYMHHEPMTDEQGQMNGYAVAYPDGYRSWCPKGEFERVARMVSKEEADLVD